MTERRSHCRSSTASCSPGRRRTPTSRGWCTAGYLRWYGGDPSWGEWLDLTDGCGAPTVAGLIAAGAIDRWHRGRTDDEVAELATRELGHWATAVSRL